HACHARFVKCVVVSLAIVALCATGEAGEPPGWPDHGLLLPTAITPPVGSISVELHEIFLGASWVPHRGIEVSAFGQLVGGPGDPILGGTGFFGTVSGKVQLVGRRSLAIALFGSAVFWEGFGDQ